jgi:superfamily II DNA or RNA helicase
MSTVYHAKYFAYELTRKGGQGIDRLSRSLFDACVDLNPHQIEAAMFAMRSPLSKGALLADEVGLGKTIEAGLVLCQYWAERRRKLLVICPASLRKQWELELQEKFNLPCFVLDAKSYQNSKSNGSLDPFDSDSLVICSFHFASRKTAELQLVPWDLVVVDEAHKLRNAYRESNRMGQNIRQALKDRRKILLTATPFQNSLLELYGLSTIIDADLFGDLPSFRAQYANVGGDIQGLRDRLQGFCTRSLRSQVTEYVKYTERRLITRRFTPTDQEHELYLAISSFLQREDSYALPRRQRHLITLLVRKVLASSPRAVAGTLEIMRDRLRRMKAELSENAGLVERIFFNGEIDDDLLDELLEDEEDLTNGIDSADEGNETGTPDIDPKRLDAEIEELDGYIRWANSIGIDTKTRALISALALGFEKMVEVGAACKAVIFTESRRTQAYLKAFLEANGYVGKVLTFNGTNREADTTAVYQRWLDKNRDTGRVSGSRSVDVRTAIIEIFRDAGQVLIATEAAAEGINLQFCSLIVNFDLPWNPQRIEQRIGRCHRYGQKHDIVVINFLNERNAADRRVYELLEEKFSLFSGIFGASDEVLGSLESGVDFERRILAIYQQCRTPEAIDAAFAALQKELDEIIEARLNDTRRLLLEHFDEDVHARLKVNLSGTRQRLDRVGCMFWELTRFILNAEASFNDRELWFELFKSPLPEAPPGRYHLINKSGKNVPSAFLYRLGHPLGEHVLAAGKRLTTPVAEITFNISRHPAHIAMVEALKGSGGWLVLNHLRIDSFDREEYLLFSGFGDDGQPLDQEVCQRLFACHGVVTSAIKPPEELAERLDADARRHIQATLSRSLETNNRHFNEARDQLEKWAQDMVLAAEKELDDLKAQIRAANRQSRLAVTMQEQHGFQNQIRKLEAKKRTLRQRIFDVEDEIAEKRDRLIDALEQRMQQRAMTTRLFALRWNVI